MIFRATSAIIGLYLLVFPAHAFEIVIKADKEGKEEAKPEEEKKDEQDTEKEPELPKDSILKVNALNQTKFNFALHVTALVKDATNQGIIIQNISPKSSLKTLGSLVAAPEATFNLDVHNTKIIATSPLNFEVTCSVLKPDAKDEVGEKDDQDKKQKDDDELPSAHESIDFRFYVPEGQDFPKCVIMFDAFLSGENEKDED